VLSFKLSFFSLFNRFWRGWLVGSSFPPLTEVFGVPALRFSRILSYLFSVVSLFVGPPLSPPLKKHPAVSFPLLHYLHLLRRQASLCVSQTPLSEACFLLHYFPFPKSLRNWTSLDSSSTSIENNLAVGGVLFFCSCDQSGPCYLGLSPFHCSGRGCLSRLTASPPKTLSNFLLILGGLWGVFSFFFPTFFRDFFLSFFSRLFLFFCPFTTRLKFLLF